MSHEHYASFPVAANGEKAAGALLDHGVRPEDISLIVQGDADHDPESADQAAKAGISTTTTGDAAAGAAKAAPIGLGVGAVAALASVFVPGVGLVLGGGALAAAIAGAAGTTVAGAIAGGTLGYLKDQGVPDDVANRYHAAVKDGGAVLSVVCPSGDVDEETIREMLSKYGASDVATFG